jgi:hypothetical protein
MKLNSKKGKMHGFFLFFSIGRPLPTSIGDVTGYNWVCSVSHQENGGSVTHLVFFSNSLNKGMCTVVDWPHMYKLTGIEPVSSNAKEIF